MIAAAQSDRNFLGCELDKSYYDKSLERYRDLVGARLPI